MKGRLLPVDSKQIKYESACCCECLRVCSSCKQDIRGRMSVSAKGTAPQKTRKQSWGARHASAGQDEIKNISLTEASAYQHQPHSKPRSCALHLQAVGFVYPVSSVYLVEEEPVAFHHHKMPLLTQMGKVNVLMVWLGWVQGAFCDCAMHIHKHHGVHRRGDPPWRPLALEANLKHTKDITTCHRQLVNRPFSLTRATHPNLSKAEDRI